jgi:fused signal recognition particle receptor
LFRNIRDSLTRTRQSVFGQIVSALGRGEITEETWEDLEALLVQADVGVPTTLALVEAFRERAGREGYYRTEQLVDAMRLEMREALSDAPPLALEAPRQLTVVMIVGVNGSGKTTSIGKLAHKYKNDGRSVMLVAADTFRAAAIDQLKIWGERVDVPVIAGQPGGDPAAITYDGIRAARARGHDLLIIDTAGRLHTKYNLMKELEKVYGVCRKSVHAAPHEVLLVLDAPTGQNALVQAQKFKESVNVSGVILAKLDGTAKGGMVFAIYRELGLPVRFVGTGESLNDLAPFDPEQFVNGLFE